MTVPEFPRNQGTNQGNQGGVKGTVPDFPDSHPSPFGRRVGNGSSETRSFITTQARASLRTCDTHRGYSPRPARSGCPHTRRIRSMEGRPAVRRSPHAPLANGGGGLINRNRETGHLHGCSKSSGLGQLTRPLLFLHILQRLSNVIWRPTTIEGC